jgi:hypothetical protein
LRHRPKNQRSSAMIIKRRRIKHHTTFQERLMDAASRFKELAEQTPPGAGRELYLRRARQAATAAQIDKWLTSPGLQPPRDLRNLAGKHEQMK